MNLSFLQYFADTYKYQSVSKAAAANNVSNTAISKAIRSLEDELDTPLIKHKKNQLIFTKNADRIHEKITEILGKVDELSTEQTPTLQRTKMGIIHSLATGRLAQTIGELSTQIDLQVLIGNPTEIKHMLSRFLIDFGVTIKRDQHLNKNEYLLHQGNFEIYQSATTKTKKNILYLTPEWPEVIAFKKHSPIFANPDLKICVIDSWDVIYAAIKEGKGIGLLPDYFKIKNTKIKKVKGSNFNFNYSVTIYHKNSFIDVELFDQFKERF